MIKWQERGQFLQSPHIQLAQRAAVVLVFASKMDVWIVWQILASLSNYDDDHSDDFKKNNRFNDQNNSSARASRFLVHFFDVHCTTKGLFT